MTRRLAILAAAVGVTLLAADSAAACSCVDTGERRAGPSESAHIGRLVAVREVDPPAEGEVVSSGDPMDYVYRVGRVFKRNGPGLRRGNRIKVRSARSEATCGLPDDLRVLYGLFLRRENGRWTAGSCDVIAPSAMRRRYAAGDSGSASSSTGMRRGARSRYCTQPG